MSVSNEKKTRFRALVRRWWRQNRRDLPWRKTKNPYCILVSEIMLQQTQVSRVIPKYQTFLKQFPTIQALARSPCAEVIRTWSGLGYNRRAVNLHCAAQHFGYLPATVSPLLKLFYS